MRAIAADARQRQPGDDDHHHFNQFHLLRALRDRPRTLREIAAFHHVTPSTMSRSVETLVQKGWVTRQDNPRDRREVILSLTESGRQEMEAMIARMRDNVAAFLSGLDEAELERAYDGLQVLGTLLVHEDCYPPVSSGPGHSPIPTPTTTMESDPR